MYHPLYQEHENLEDVLLERAGGEAGRKSILTYLNLCNFDTRQLTIGSPS